MLLHLLFDDAVFIQTFKFENQTCRVEVYAKMQPTDVPKYKKLKLLSSVKLSEEIIE